MCGKLPDEPSGPRIEYPGVSLHPGELVHGALGRLQYRWGMQLRSFIRKLLHGRSERIRSAYDFRAALLWSELWKEPGQMQILTEHTLLPSCTWRIRFSGQKPRRITLRSGTVVDAYMPNLTHTTYYKFCPACWEEQISRHGEAHWDVLCQIPGVDVCLKHKIPLRITPMRLDGRNVPRGIGLGFPMCDLSMDSYEMPRMDHSYLIAQSARNLLRRKNLQAVKITEWLEYLCFLLVGERVDMATQYKLLQSQELVMKISGFWGVYYRDNEGWLYPLKNLKGIGWWGWLKLLKAIDPEKDLADAIDECCELMGKNIAKV